ncbi:conserved protein of unknown function [Caballeronia sp. S22]
MRIEGVRKGAARRAGKKNPADGLDFSHNDLAERTGLEPATPGVTGRYSNQLNYRSTSLIDSQCHLRTLQRFLLAAADVLASPRGFEPLYSP